MRKASRIIYLVAAILSIFAGVGALCAGLLLVIIPNTESFISAFIEGYNANPTEGVDVLDALEFTQFMMIYSGVLCLISACCAGVNSFLGFRAHHEAKPSKALNVLNIIFAVLSCVEVNIVAAIFAFIADHQEENKAIEQK